MKLSKYSSVLKQKKQPSVYHCHLKNQDLLSLIHPPLELHAVYVKLYVIHL